MADFAITNASVVLPEQVVEHATVHVRDGLIQAVQTAGGMGAPDGREVLDAGGAYLMPGVIDLHNDGLEIEVNPRPRASLPLPFAFNNIERRLISAGVTTEFHAIGFMERPAALRTILNARERTAYIAELARGPARVVDHHVLHRINVRDRAALDIVFDSLDSFAVRYASLDDHTPGQGQYRDIDKLQRHLQQAADVRGEVAQEREDLERRMALAVSDTETVPYVHGRVSAECVRRPITLASHDDHSPDKVDQLHAVGASIAEFPVALEAAARARERGMAIVVGAPNVLRGGSQSGNVAAGELIQHGLADIVCADYHAPSMLAAVFRIWGEGLRDLPAATRMVTLNPAQALGLHDRGAIAPGLRADLIVVHLDENGFPHVTEVVSGGRRTYSFAAQPFNARQFVAGGIASDG